MGNAELNLRSGRGGGWGSFFGEGGEGLETGTAHGVHDFYDDSEGGLFTGFQGDFGTRIGGEFAFQRHGEALGGDGGGVEENAPRFGHKNNGGRHIFGRLGLSRFREIDFDGGLVFTKGRGDDKEDQHDAKNVDQRDDIDRRSATGFGVETHDSERSRGGRGILGRGFCAGFGVEFAEQIHADSFQLNR